MVVNFRARGISRGACKLVRTLTLINKKSNLTKIILLLEFTMNCERMHNKKAYLSSYCSRDIGHTGGPIPS
jgi:hypothetical protein